ncbi:MAG: hypothetical protein QG551_446 [Patescibacteria group bacterium]|nr:hypothetical protein [Patescibacteria group bacterium]
MNKLATWLVSAIGIVIGLILIVLNVVYIVFYLMDPSSFLEYYLHGNSEDIMQLHGGGKSVLWALGLDVVVGALLVLMSRIVLRENSN